MDVTYRVVFHYNGKEPGEFTKARIESALAQVYNKYCDMVNPCYGEWNEAYTGANDFEVEDGEYITYIKTMAQPYLDKLNLAWRRTKNLLSPPIREFFLGPECNFSARLNDGTEVQFFLKAE